MRFSIMMISIGELITEVNTEAHAQPGSVIRDPLVIYQDLPGTMATKQKAKEAQAEASNGLTHVELQQGTPYMLAPNAKAPGIEMK
ncbi:hypothetical protein ABEF95_012640 [Exophiala dermatitidis]